MPKTRTTSPLTTHVGQYAIEVTAERLWGWSLAIDTARDKISADPATAILLLKAVSGELDRHHAMARKDDPTLPGHYRSLLED